LWEGSRPKIGIETIDTLPVATRKDLGGREDDFVLNATPDSIQREGSGRQLTAVFLDRLLRGAERAQEELDDEFAPALALHTAGTTGTPATVWMTRRDLAQAGMVGARALQVAGVRPSSTVLNLMFPGAVGGYWGLWLGATALGTRQLATGPLGADVAAETIRKEGVETVIASGIDALELLEDSNPHSLQSLKTIIIPPEVLPATLYGKLWDAVPPQARIIRTYGFAESRWVWSECRNGAGQPEGGFHTYPDQEIIRLIASEGDPSSIRGEIEFTALDQRGSALLRYRPGDIALGGLAIDRCRYCGRAVDRILGPIVRASNLLAFQMEEFGEMLIDVRVLESVMDHSDLKAWVFKLAKSGPQRWTEDDIFIHVEAKEGKDPVDVIVDLETAFRRELGFSPSQFVVDSGLETAVVDSR
jgi:phenylacetate-coenzyme A ligase PaaK-like adenylate-forming protein